MRGLKWSKLLDPDKKGQWWLSRVMASTREMLKRLLAQLTNILVKIIEKKNNFINMNIFQ